MRELLIAYLQTQTQEAFRALREAVAASDAYEPYDGYQQQLGALLKREQYAEARELLRHKMDGWVLNPGFHMHMSFVCHKLNDADAARAERYIARAVAQGIFDSGDGSRAQPYLVMRTADEYDLLEFLDKTPGGQQLVTEEQRVLDLLTCADGTELWFDVTLPFTRLRGGVSAA